MLATTLCVRAVLRLRLSRRALGRFCDVATHRGGGVHHALLFGLLSDIGEHATRRAACVTVGIARGTHLARQESMRVRQLVPCGLCSCLCPLSDQRRLVGVRSSAQEGQLKLILDSSAGR